MKKKFIFCLIPIFLILSGLFFYCNLKNAAPLYAHHHKGHHGGHHHGEVCTVICKDPEWGTYCDWEYTYDWDLKQCCTVKCFKKNR